MKQHTFPPRTSSCSSSRSLRTPLLGASTALLLMACVSEPAEPAYEDPLTLGSVSVQLTRAESCDDLLDAIQGGAVAELGQLVQRIREVGEDGYYGYGDDGFITEEGMDFAPPGIDNVSVNSSGAVSGSTGNGSASPATDPAFQESAPRVDNNGSDGDSNQEDLGTNDGSDGFSGTTVQVADVDEADIVKTDGDRMYVLHGGTLLALSAWPADETSLIASALIEGEPIEMFVHQGKAVVFSRVYQDLAAVAEGVSDNESRYYYNYTPYTKITVLDVSGDSEDPGVVRESYIEGNYSSARRHDGIVRAVVEDGYKVPSLGNPNIEFRDPFGEPYSQQDIDTQLQAWAARMTRAIRATDLGDWLPREFEAQGQTLTAVPPRCNDYYRPDTGLTDSGVTSVVALDLDNVDATLKGATILGRAERVYANTEALVITQTDYRYQFDENISPEQTVLHRFEVDGDETAYTASGSIAGRIHNQFSLDERNGVIRVSTTEERRQNFAVEQTDPGVSVMGASAGGAGGAAATPNTVREDSDEDQPTDETPKPTDQELIAAEELAAQVQAEGSSSLDTPIAAGGPFVPTPASDNGPINRVITLGVDGNQLVELGATEQFGATERIYATRFMGDRAYVVTFRRTDPLFVLDMSDDADPTVVGELHIPGFSDYLFPVDANHLFAIGRDADDNGRVRGLSLQLFDVTNATAPLLVDRYTYGDNSFSPGNVDHRAISFHNDGSKVAFPFQDYRNNQQTLEVFEVSTETGLTRLGGVNSLEDRSLEECLRSIGYDPNSIEEIEAEIERNPEFAEEFEWQCNYYGREFKRAVFRDDVLFGVSPTGLYSYDLNNLDAGIMSSLSFPAEVYGGDNFGTKDPLVEGSPPRPASNLPGRAETTQDVDEAVENTDEVDSDEGDTTDEEETDSQ